MQAARYKLGLLAGKKRFTHMPEQLDDETYGTISGAFGKDAQEACYVVRFVGRSQVEILGYVNMSGEVYRTCAPVKDAALPDVPDLVIRKSPDAESGSISVLDEHGRLRCISHFKGAVEGTMRENADEPTWNSKRSLRYGDFLASLYLRYCVFGAAGTGAISSGSPNAEHERFDIEMHALDEPVELFCGFASASLPDAIDALLYRIESNQNPCGLELYAKRLMSEVDLPCLRTCSVKTTLTLARIERTRSFFVNFDRSGLSHHEVETVLSVETVLNRLSRMLDRMGAGMAPTSMSPSEEDCSRIDRRVFDETTGQVAQLLEQLSEPNPWAMPGTIQCTPGGEWDVRTRFARLAEGINVITRLDYRFDVDVSRGAMRVQFMQPPCAAMPRSFYDEPRAGGPNTMRAKFESCARNFYRAWSLRWRRPVLRQGSISSAALYRSIHCSKTSGPRRGSRYASTSSRARHIWPSGVKSPSGSMPGRLRGLHVSRRLKTRYMPVRRLGPRLTGVRWRRQTICACCQNRCGRCFWQIPLRSLR